MGPLNPGAGPLGIGGGTGPPLIICGGIGPPGIGMNWSPAPCIGGLAGKGGRILTGGICWGGCGPGKPPGPGGITPIGGLTPPYKTQYLLP